MTPCWCGAPGEWQVPPFDRLVCEEHATGYLLGPEAEEKRRCEAEDDVGCERAEREAEMDESYGGEW